MQNKVISTRISSLYGSQPSSVVFACKTAPLVHNCKSLLVPALICGFCMQKATFGSDIQVSIGPRLRLLICALKTACLVPEWRLSIGPSLHLWFSSFKTATLGSQLLVSMRPRPHLWFCMQNSDIMTRINSLYESQTSPVVLWIQNCLISIRNTSLYGSQPSFVVFACKTANLVSMGPRPQLSFCSCKTTRLASELLVSLGSSPHLWCLHAKQLLLDQN